MIMIIIFFIYQVTYLCIVAAEQNLGQKIGPTPSEKLVRLQVIVYFSLILACSKFGQSVEFFINAWVCIPMLTEYYDGLFIVRQMLNFLGNGSYKQTVKIG